MMKTLLFLLLPTLLLTSCGDADVDIDVKADSTEQSDADDMRGDRDDDADDDVKDTTDAASTGGDTTASREPSEREKDAAAGTPTRVRFTKGATGSQQKGMIEGYDVKEYLLGAKGGQFIEVQMESDNRDAFFTIEHAGTNERIFDGSLMGEERMSFYGDLPHDGDYRVSVMLPRAEARSNGVAHYTLEFDIRDL